ncbi:hypothetical protein SMAC4_13017 [Sordaria macrospora]|uniref:uncharacterized protein n=1 Tax=Sordaria macrospora TaxID=5147 RepID=UPI002B29E364|nr:hypothetical protein SMAC4_13017 [Sordaria macrospora]
MVILTPPFRNRTLNSLSPAIPYRCARITGFLRCRSRGTDRDVQFIRLGRKR